MIGTEADATLVFCTLLGPEGPGRHEGNLELTGTSGPTTPSGVTVFGPWSESLVSDDEGVPPVI